MHDSLRREGLLHGLLHAGPREIPRCPFQCPKDSKKGFNPKSPNQNNSQKPDYGNDSHRTIWVCERGVSHYIHFLGARLMGVFHIFSKVNDLMPATNRHKYTLFLNDKKDGWLARYLIFRWHRIDIEHQRKVTKFWAPLILMQSKWRLFLNLPPLQHVQLPSQRIEFRSIRTLVTPSPGLGV